MLVIELSGANRHASVFGCDNRSLLGAIVLNFFLDFTTGQHACGGTHSHRNVAIADVLANRAANHHSSDSVPVIRIDHRRDLLIPAFLLNASGLSGARLLCGLLVEE
jgi:hypothetical protein